MLEYVKVGFCLCELSTYFTISENESEDWISRSILMHLTFNGKMTAFVAGPGVIRPKSVGRSCCCTA